MRQYNSRNFIYVCQDDCCAHRGSCNETEIYATYSKNDIVCGEGSYKKLAGELYLEL
jgi:hypothetical protein